MVFNTTFNYFSYIVAVSLLVEESGVLGEDHHPAHKSLTNYIKKCCIEYTLHEWDLNSQLNATFNNISVILWQ